jgi:hypothetical protein
LCLGQKSSTTGDFVFLPKLQNDFQEMQQKRFFKRYSGAAYPWVVDLLLQYLTPLARLSRIRGR